MTTATAMGLAGAALLLLNGAMLIVARWKPGRATAVATVAAMTLAGFVPVRDSSLAEYLWSLTGHLSAPTLLLLAHAAMRRADLAPRHEPQQFSALMRLVAPVAVLFYPLALGFTPVDPYAWGYQPFWILLGMLFLFVCAVIRGKHLVANLLTAGVLAWLLDLYDSGNLWDYLLDPLLAFFALGHLGWNHGGRNLWREHGWKPGPTAQGGEQHAG